MKVSIITPTYNSAKTIKRTLESIEMQIYRDFEHIIIDGESKDRTIDYIQTYSNSNRYLYSEPDKGIYDAMNKGINKATGDIIAILNSDDFFSDENVLQDVVNLFKKGSDIVYGGIRFCNSNGDLLTTWISSEYKRGDFASGWHTPHPAFFARRSLYKIKGGFSLKYPVAADFDLMLRFMNDPSVICSYLPKILTILQNDGNSSKFKNIIQGFKDIHHSMNENNIPVNPLLYAFRRYASKIYKRRLN